MMGRILSILNSYRKEHGNIKFAIELIKLPIYPFQRYFTRDVSVSCDVGGKRFFFSIQHIGRYGDFRSVPFESVLEYIKALEDATNKKRSLQVETNMGIGTDILLIPKWAVKKAYELFNQVYQDNKSEIDAWNAIILKQEQDTLEFNKKQNELMWGTKEK